MELFHVHLIGNHDKLYHENSVFTVDKNKFKNRMYYRIYNMTPTVDVKDYSRIMKDINFLCNLNGIGSYDSKINLGEIITYILHKKCTEEEIRKALEQSSRILLDEAINLREMAMEEYRKNNCPEIPSRLHSLFACSEEGIGFWNEKIYDNDTQIFKIEVDEEPFVSNEQLLPIEGLSYGDKIDASYSYFHPRKKDLDPETNEYLVQGKVKILERIY